MPVMPVKLLFSTDNENFLNRKHNIMFETHVCLPAIVQEFDSREQTVSVQPCIREKFTNQNGESQYVDYPLLINVPVVFPGSSTFFLHFPLKQGDEGIVIFADLSIDNWFESGGVQNPIEYRRHDLSDGFFIPGVFSEPRATAMEFPNSLILKNKNGVGIEITENAIYGTGDNALGVRVTKNLLSQG